MDIESGDYTLTPCGKLGGKVSVCQEGKCLGEFVETEDALKFVSERMDDEQFWPNIWWISDHGNGWMIDNHGNEIERCEEDYEDNDDWGDEDEDDWDEDDEDDEDWDDDDYP